MTQQPTATETFGFSTSGEVKRTDLVKKTDKAEQFVRIVNVAAQTAVAAPFKTPMGMVKS